MKFHNFHQGCCGYNPTRADGSEWAHVVSLPDGSSVYADSADEALEEIIEGYAGARTLPDTEAGTAALRLRTRHAEQVAVEVQEAAITAARRDGLLRPGEVADEGLLEILRLPKTSALTLTDPDHPGEVLPWQAPVPLVLVATAYAPHESTPPVAGDVVWLDPSRPEAYLASLGTARYVDYWTDRWTEPTAP